MTLLSWSNSIHKGCHTRFTTSPFWPRRVRFVQKARAQDSPDWFRSKRGSRRKTEKTPAEPQDRWMLLRGAPVAEIAGADLSSDILVFRTTTDLMYGKSHDAIERYNAELYRNAAALLTRRHNPR